MFSRSAELINDKPFDPDKLGGYLVHARLTDYNGATAFGVIERLGQPISVSNGSGHRDCIARIDLEQRYQCGSMEKDLMPVWMEGYDV